jgi:hypothetical protein
MRIVQFTVSVSDTGRGMPLEDVVDEDLDFAVEGSRAPA